MHNKIELDAQTGETIVSEMTALEEAEHLERIKKAEFTTKAKAAALIAKQAEREAVLDKLGLTADEAAALLG